MIKVTSFDGKLEYYEVRCPGSGERSDRVHSSGAIMCPACNGAYLAPGMVLPEHTVEAERPIR
jgi:hypothetical protein